jgi:hypothetical protein
MHFARDRSNAKSFGVPSKPYRIAVIFAVLAFALFAGFQTAHFHPETLSHDSDQSCPLCAAVHPGINLVRIGIQNIVFLPGELVFQVPMATALSLLNIPTSFIRPPPA